MKSPMQEDDSMSRVTAPSIDYSPPNKMEGLEMFEQGVRTAHTNIPPAKDRLLEMKTRTLL